MNINGDFSWRNFILGFMTRKFLIAVAVQITATLLALHAFDIVGQASTAPGTGKSSVDAKTVIEIFSTWSYFTIANASAFGLFNSTSKMANNSLEKIKKLPNIPGIDGIINKVKTKVTQATQTKEAKPTTGYKDPREG